MTGSRIARVAARQILNSRGRPTVEADVQLEDGTLGRASAPSGASTGRHEAHELRDGDRTGFRGARACTAPSPASAVKSPRALTGRDAEDQRGIDEELRTLDGTANLSRLGANAVLATSLAAARAAAAHQRQPLHEYLSTPRSGVRRQSLPLPMTNILSGGAHAGGAMDFQDFLAVPVGARTFAEAISMLARVRSAAADELAGEGRSVLLADEGGLSPGYGSAGEALDLMMRSFARAGLNAGADVAIAIDVAATELFEDGAYVLRSEAAEPRWRGHGRICGRALPPLSDCIGRGSACRGRLGTLAAIH